MSYIKTCLQQNMHLLYHQTLKIIKEKQKEHSSSSVSKYE